MSLEAAGSNPVSATMKAVRIVFDMSAAPTGVAAKIAAHVAMITAAIVAPRLARHRSDIVMVSGLFSGGVAPCQVDVVIKPRMLLVHRVLEALHPGLHQNVLV